MFERIKGLWKSMVGGAAHAEADERRVWVRHPSEARTTVRALDNGTDTRLSARVRNVSRGGIHLLVEHAFEPGDMISIVLPDDGADETLLACIVHVTELGDGRWGLGCAFSEEMDEASLTAFGMRASGANQRASVRFPCRVSATYSLASARAAQPRAVEVVDVSAHGIGLIVAEPLEAGALLTVTLTGAHGGTVGSILACVVHVSHRPGAAWMVGCNFIRELSEADLKALA